MKILSAICGVAALATAAVNVRILGLFAEAYQKLDMPLPAVTRALLWKNGLLPAGVLVASALVAFVGLARSNRPVANAGAAASMIAVVLAAMLMPAALILPMDALIHPPGREIPAATPPEPVPAPAPAPESP